MNSDTLRYQAQPFTGLINHGAFRTFFVRDGADDQPSVADLMLEAQIRSGDYFITLATALDQLGKEADDYDVRVGLEDTVSDLLHLQDNYEIVKKSPPK